MDAVVRCIGFLSKQLARRRWLEGFPNSYITAHSPQHAEFNRDVECCDFWIKTSICVWRKWWRDNKRKFWVIPQTMSLSAAWNLLRKHLRFHEAKRCRAIGQR